MPSCWGEDQGSKMRHLLGDQTESLREQISSKLGQFDRKRNKIQLEATRSFANITPRL
jgi:hypothetical protein